MPGSIPRPRPNSSYGFGSRIDRFTAIQSTPSSPMVENSPLKWFIRDIDIGDNSKGTAGATSGARPVTQRPGFKPEQQSSTEQPNMFGHRIVRTRSRHDCHFATGASVPMGKKNLKSLSKENAL